MCKLGEYLHALGVALDVVKMAVVASIPSIEGLVQAIKPIGGSRKIDDLLTRHVERDKLGDGMADEHISILDVAPEKLPDIVLGGPFLRHEVGPDLNVRAIENWAVRSNFLDQGNETRHLRVVNLDYQDQPSYLNFAIVGH